ncbi:MAG: hypothetical protein H7Z18_11270 [Methylophilaceae bacterium]|nr:hypothetical protein [Methylophilaceae bacterium]
MNITFFCPIDFDDVKLSSHLVTGNTQLLNSLLAVGKRRMINLTMAELICQQFSVKQTSDYPLASLAAPTSADDMPHYYLQADPVHLILQRDAVVLSDPAALVVTQDELETLCQLLNQHFSEDSFAFELSESEFSQSKLLLRLNKALKISTTLPEKVIGRNIYGYLPQGEDASYWNKVTNEIQMLLHEHQLNQQREMRQLPAINSIWLSGGGTLPQAHVSLVNQVISDIPYVQKLAKLAKVDCEFVPNHLKFVLNQQVLIALRPNTDITHWIEILYRLVQQGATLQLNLTHQDVVLVTETRPKDLYKSWLFKLLGKNKAVLSYFQAYYQGGTA